MSQQFHKRAACDTLNELKLSDLSEGYNLPWFFSGLDEFSYSESNNEPPRQLRCHPSFSKEGSY